MNQTKNHNEPNKEQVILSKEKQFEAMITTQSNKARSNYRPTNKPKLIK